MNYNSAMGEGERERILVDYHGVKREIVSIGLELKRSTRVLIS